MSKREKVTLADIKNDTLWYKCAECGKMKILGFQCKSPVTGLCEVLESDYLSTQNQVN